MIASYVGDGAPILIQRALGGETIDEALVRKGLEFFLSYYREHKLDHTTVYPGIVEALVAIQSSSNGMPRKMAVLSNKPVNPSRAIVEALGLGQFFCRFMAATASPPRSRIPKVRASCWRRAECDRSRLRLSAILTSMCAPGAMLGCGRLGSPTDSLRTRSTMNLLTWWWNSRAKSVMCSRFDDKVEPQKAPKKSQRTQRSAHYTSNGTKNANDKS